MSWSEFFSMGGYAFYVWGSYMLALIAMGGEVLLVLRRRRNLLRRTSHRTGFTESNKHETTS